MGFERKKFLPQKEKSFSSRMKIKERKSFRALKRKGQESDSRENNLENPFQEENDDEE